MTEPLSVPLSSQPVTISHNNSCRGVWDICNPVNPLILVILIVTV
jgi:hypothetical protein